MKRLTTILSLIMAATMLLAACAPAATEAPLPTATEPPAPTEPPTPEWIAPDGALVAVKSDSAPTLDGIGDDAVWANAEEIVIQVKGGFDGFTTEVHLKAIYTEDSVYFLMSYADPTESWFRSPWQKQEDGTWKKVTDPDDKGGDNNLVYEDKFAFIWPINNSIVNFETDGCLVACHVADGTGKPYGNKYTAGEGQMGDIWHWKSVRNLLQIDDQYLDWTPFDAEKSPEAGRHSDPKDSGGYSDNYATMPDPADPSKTVADKSKPGFGSAGIDMTTGAPGYILDSEKTALDQAALDAMPAGSYLPGIIKSQITGDRGNITAGWKWENGTWTIEFGRLLDTGSEYDVQFTDLTAMYYFGIAVFENAQVRHAFQKGSSFLVFKP